MIFGGSVRSSRSTLLLVASFVFITAFVCLVYNHLESWDVPSTSRPPPGQQPPVQGGSSPPPLPPVTHESAGHEPVSHEPVSSETSDLITFYLEKLHRPSIQPDSKSFKPYGVFGTDLPGKARWDKPLGEKLCIIDLDNRKFEQSGQIFGPEFMSWDRPDKVHGLSLGVLNHWLYAKIHGYKYYYVAIEAPEDRRASWKKPPVMSQILKDHDACIYLDSDAIFHHLDLPFEWLMNYWELHPDTNSLALAIDPQEEFNKDKFGKLYLNTGFIIAQNNKKTYEIMDSWQACPDDGGKHPDCTKFRKNEPGKPTDQGGFGTFIRYDYPNDIKELPCTEANGFPQSGTNCAGKFIRHLWTGKDTNIKVGVGEQLPGAYLEIFHKQYLAEKKNFYITEAELMARGTEKRS